MKEKEILDKFRHGDGLDYEDIKMFKLALKRLHEEEDELVKKCLLGTLSFRYPLTKQYTNKLLVNSCLELQL